MVLRIIALVIEAYVVVLIVRALLSWVPVRPGSPVAGISTGTISLGPAVVARSAGWLSRSPVIRGPRDRGSLLTELPTDVVIASPP